MTPTQAQIELVRITAELRHLYENIINGYVKDYKNLANGLLSPQIKRLEALTAAAEVGEMRAFGASEFACSKWPEDTPEHKALRAAFIEGAALTAAAEVGEQAVDFLDNAPIHLADRNATIERCAQVADKWLAYGVAEDIRALKDKP